MRFGLLILALFTAVAFVAFAQRFPGYTLIAPQGGRSVWLLDSNDNTYKTWSNLQGITGYSCYLLPNQTLLRSVAYTGNMFFGGGQTGIVQKIDRNGNLIWNYQYSTSTYSMHHDICPMPNGNVLLISYELKTPAEASAAGCESSITIWSEKIVEIQPVGSTGGNVVWEWHVWDHLCQDKYPDKANYVSSIVKNPQLFNINRQTAKDWLHMNGIDYNAQLDQIIISSHNWSEFFIIDHSTTTAQAASRSGGKSGKGGDILYRWGNPANYGASGQRSFNVIHDAHWVPQDCPNAGYVVGFNNGATSRYSSGDYINPPLNGYSYNITPGEAYEPTSYSYRKLASGKTTNMGNIQELPNGNVLMCIALSGKIYEYAPSGDLVWSHSAGKSVPMAWRYSLAYVDSGSSNPTIAAAASPQSVCSGDAVRLSSVVGGGSGFTFAWKSNPPGFVSTEQNVAATPLQNTVYIVTATNGAITISDSVTVTVKSRPAVSAIAGKINAQRNASEQYSITPIIGATYLWDAIGGTVISGKTAASATVAWNNKDSGTVSVTVTGANGCNSVASQSVKFSGQILSVMPGKAELPYMASERRLFVNATGEWSATKSADWLSISRNSGKGDDFIDVIASENNSAEYRSAAVKIVSGTQETETTIFQAAKSLLIGRRKVKFTVDMRYENVNATGVHVAGDFQAAAGFSGGNWQPNTTPMKPEASSSLYSVTVEVPVNAKYEYKFLNGDQFYDTEFVPEASRVNDDIDNRWFVADSTLGDTIYVGPVIYGKDAAQGKALVRFRVDMRNAVPISPSGVHVAGSFQGEMHQWDAMRNMMYSFADNVYEALAYITPNSSINYKFYNGNTAAAAEIIPSVCSADGTRRIVVTGDTVLTDICFSSCTKCAASDIAENYGEIIGIFPNPFAENPMLRLPQGEYSVIIVDALGREVFAQSYLRGGQTSLNATWPAAGLYLLQITDLNTGNTRVLPMFRQ